MPVFLTLGPILFADFEIPEKLPFGGAQTLVVKKLVGGDRVVDAMGRDDDDKAWSGRFRGQFAESRARELDSLRIQGQPLVLTWSTLRYLVVISKFNADFMQPFEIPYSITCLVLEDLSNPILPTAPGVDATINSDVNSAGLLAPTIGVPSITAALATVSASTAVVGSFGGASVAQLTVVQSSLAVALGATNGQISLQNASVAASGSVAGAVGGQNPQAIAAALTAQSSAFGQLGSLYQLQALLGRTRINVQNAGS